MLAGVFNKLPFYWIEMNQAVDFMANSGVASTIAFSAVTGKGKQSRIICRSADVIVFATPIATITDLFVCPINDPNKGYADRKLKDVSFEFELYRTLDKDNQPDGYYSLCSDKRFAVAGAFDELKKILVKYPDLSVQIFGGFVAVHRQPFDTGNLMGCVCTQSEIKEFFDVARAIYDALKNVERLFLQAHTLA